jgi:prephenate dehydrogenase
LYKGARIWLVAGDAAADDVTRVEGFWRSLGGEPRVISADEHDALMVWISHLPQLTSNALATALLQAGHGKGSLGPGGRDMTRLAGSGPEMWEDLLNYAPSGLQEALKAVEDTLSEFRFQLAKGDSKKIAEQMERTRKWSRSPAE